MFSSNQIFKVSGDMRQLESAIEFAVNMFDKPRNLCYQITDDGKYCLGWSAQDGWLPLPFDFNAHIVAEIVKQHLAKHEPEESEYDYMDGGTGDGFLMEVIPNTFSDEEDGIKNPFYGIVSIKSFKNYYAK